MRSAASSLVIALIAAVLMLLPAEHFVGPPRHAHAASGATYGFPPNYSLDGGKKEVGDGPTNYDFSSGGSGWYALGVTFSGGVAKMTNSSLLRSAYFTLEDDVQAIKVRFKAGADASVAIQKQSGGSYVGTDNLSCPIGCTTGEWTEKYIGMYPSAYGSSVRIVFSQSGSGKESQIDEAGVQFITFNEWHGSGVGVKAQPKNDLGEGHVGFMELRSNMYTRDFVLTDNRIEFDYAFPLASDNSLAAYLHLESDDSIIGSTGKSGSGTGWTRIDDWSVSSGYIGHVVYLRFYSPESTPSWVDNVAINLGEGLLLPTHPSEDDGDPFDTTTGQFSHSHTDVAVPGKGVPLHFTRYYHSMMLNSGDLGVGWTHNYSTSLRIHTDDSVTVNYGTGGAAFFEEDGGSFTAPAGVHDTLVENMDGTYALTTKGAIEYNFTSAGKLTDIVDRNGNTTTVSYDMNGYLSEVEDPGGRALTFTVDGQGRITEIEDPLERTVGFQYDSNGDLEEVTDTKGGTTTYTYDSHRMTSLTDSNGHLQNETIYDSANRVVEQEDAVGGITCVYYGTSPSYSSANCTGTSPSPSAGQTVVVDPRGYKTTYDFDTQFRTTDITDHNDGITSFEYDSDNNRTCVTDSLGNKTGLTYDSNGNITHVIDAENTDANCDLDTNGVQWTFTYTSKNDIDLATDPLGRETDYVYDGSGNLTQVKREDDQSNILMWTCFTPDGDGLVTEVDESTTLTNCTGNTTLFDYDTYGNLDEIVDPRFSGQGTPPKTTLAYDLGGRLQTVTNELSEVTTYTYDDHNRLLTLEDELGNATSRTYDQKGNLKTITDANRQPVSTPESGADCGTAGTGDGVDDDSDTVVDDGCPNFIYNYDDADRLIEVIDALGNSTTYGYDENGNRTSVTNANRQAVSTPESGADCGTDGTGDGEDDDSDTVIDDGCPSTIYVYDELDRLESVIDALGRTTDYVYDDASNLIERTDPRGLVTEYEYDELNRLTLREHWDGETLVDDVDYTYDEIGNRETMVDDTGTTSYGYDPLNRPLEITFPGNTVVSYEYDEVGNREKITYPDTKEVDYTYDEAHNLETVTDWIDEVTTYTYDAVGRLENTALPNGIDTDYTYDGAGRLDTLVNADQTPTTISSFDYEVDAVGNRVEMEDLEGTHSYEYDALYRLTEVTYPDMEVDAYTYDAVGNRLTKGTDDYTYDAADQLTDLEGTGFDYDDNGNQTDRGSDTFDYDHENRLIESVIDSVTSSSVYNGDGLRVSHTVGMTTTSYVWDVAAGLPVVLQDVDNTYVYGLDLISATDSQGDQTYFLYDGLGSVTDVTDESGDVVASYRYDVFGAIRSVNGSTDNYWLFTGEQHDEDSGLYYLRARYYDPTTGRFLSVDPIMAAEPYAYVSSNPGNLRDPSGQCALGLPCPDLPDPPSLPDPRDIVNPAIDLLPDYLIAKVFGFNLSAELIAMCVLYPDKCAVAAGLSLIAQKEAERLYGPGGGPEGTRANPKEGDAFRHCFWSGLLTIFIDAGFAEDFTHRYESWPGNDEAQKQYDLDNDKRGIQFAKALNWTPAGPLSTLALHEYCRT